MSSSSERTRVAVVGLGSIAAKVYLPELTQRPDVEVIALSSRRPETVQRYGDLYRIEQRFTSVDDVLGLSPHIVFIHAATVAHFELVEQCLQSDIPVFVDKPLTNDIDLSKQLTEFATSKSLLLAVGFNRRFAPLVVQAHSLISHPAFVQIEKHRSMPGDTPAPTTLYDDVIHLVDTLVSITGSHVELTDYEQRTDNKGCLLFSGGTLTSSHCVARFAMYREAGVDFERLSFHGDHTSVEVVNLEQLVANRYDVDARKSTTTHNTFGSWDTTLKRRGFSTMVDHVLSCLDKPSACSINASRVLRSHEIVDELINWSA